MSCNGGIYELGLGDHAVGRVTWSDERGSDLYSRVAVICTSWQ